MIVSLSFEKMRLSIAVVSVAAMVAGFSFMVGRESTCPIVWNWAEAVSDNVREMVRKIDFIGAQRYNGFARLTKVLTSYNIADYIYN